MSITFSNVNQILKPFPVEVQSPQMFRQKNRLEQLDPVQYHLFWETGFKINAKKKKQTLFLAAKETPTCNSALGLNMSY